MQFGCKIKNYLQLPTGCELIIDWINLGVALVGTGIVLFGIGLHNGSLDSHFAQEDMSLAISLNISYTNMRQRFKFHDMMAFLMALVAGVCFGCSLGEIRILCYFKEIREKCYEQNYVYLKPIFFSLLICEFLMPALSLPSGASYEVAQREISGA